MMKLVAGEVDKGRSAVFVLYEGNWSHSIELVKQVVQTESALLAYSTLPADTAAALRAYVEPVAEEWVAKRWSRTTRSTSRRNARLPKRSRRRRRSQLQSRPRRRQGAATT